MLGPHKLHLPFAEFPSRFFQFQNRTLSLIAAPFPNPWRGFHAQLRFKPQITNTAVHSDNTKHTTCQDLLLTCSCGWPPDGARSIRSARSVLKLSRRTVYERWRVLILLHIKETCKCLREKRIGDKHFALWSWVVGLIMSEHFGEMLLYIVYLISNGNRAAAIK
jgi:hypothetical protein